MALLMKMRSFYLVGSLEKDSLISYFVIFIKHMSAFIRDQQTIRFVFIVDFR